ICSTSDTTVCTPGDAILQTIGLGFTPTFLKYDTHSARVLVAGGGTIGIINAGGIQPTTSTNFTLQTIGGFSGNTWVTALPDGTRIYVSDSVAGTVTVYNAGNLALIKTIDLDANVPGTKPIMIDSDKNSTKVYTANQGSNDFTIIRTLDDTEVLQT